MTPTTSTQPVSNPQQDAHPPLRAGFWIHFPEDAATGQAAIDTHLDYFRTTGVDLAKVMCENLQPDNGLLTEPGQWRALRPMRPGDDRFEDQIRIIAAIRDAMGPDVTILATVHSLVASAFHASGRVGDYERDRHIIADHLRADPASVDGYLAAVAESLTELGDASLAAGADGIYLAALGGERAFITDEEHARHIAPLESAMLDHFNQCSDANILHICKENLNLDRYRDYHPQAVSWSVKPPNPSLAEGFKIFPDATIVGGINHRDPRWDATDPAEVAAMVTDAIANATDLARYVVAADCTLDSAVIWPNIATAVHTAHQA